jgi:hypothetical protein
MSGPQVRDRGLSEVFGDNYIQESGFSGSPDGTRSGDGTITIGQNIAEPSGNSGRVRRQFYGDYGGYEEYGMWSGGGYGGGGFGGGGYGGGYGGGFGDYGGGYGGGGDIFIL